MKFRSSLLVGVAAALAVAGVAYGMSQNQGNRPPRVAYLHVATSGIVDLARTSPGVTVYPSPAGGQFCVSADFTIRGGSVTAGPDTTGNPPGLALNGAPDAPPNAFGPGSFCGDAGAFVESWGLGVYITLVD